MAEPTAAPPDPADDEEAYDSIGLGTYTWTREHGALEIDVPSPELKTDDQSASGTDKSKIKISGVNNASGTIKFSWTRAQAARKKNEQMALLWAFNPNNPEGKGKPIDVRSPYFAGDGIHQILFTKYDKLVVKGDYRERVAHWKEWTEPPKAVAGATTTPTDPMQWTAKQNPPMDPGKTTAKKGFGGPKAPSTSPK